MPPIYNTRHRPSFELGFAPPICEPATCTIAPVSQAYTSDRVIARAATKFASSFTSHFTSLHFAWLQLCEPGEFISNSQMHQKADIRITSTWPQSLFVHKNKESQRSNDPGRDDRCVDLYTNFGQFSHGVFLQENPKG